MLDTGGVAYKLSLLRENKVQNFWHHDHHRKTSIVGHRPRPSAAKWTGPVRLTSNVVFTRSSVNLVSANSLGIAYQRSEVALDSSHASVHFKILIQLI